MFQNKMKEEREGREEGGREEGREGGKETEFLT